MIIYHVDKFGILKPGDSINSPIHTAIPFFQKDADICQISSFFDDKLQMFALQTLKEGECGDYTLAIIEAVLEYVRALKFPKLPSRMSVLYASRTTEEAGMWLYHMRPTNPEAQIVSLCTGRKVYSANRALRDEMYARIADIVDAVPSGSLCRLRRLLAVALPLAEHYWKSIAPTPRMLCSRNLGFEELLVVPPARVLHQVSL